MERGRRGVRVTVSGLSILAAVAVAAAAAGYAAGGLRCAAAGAAVAVAGYIAAYAGLLPVIGVFIYNAAYGHLAAWYTSICPAPNPVITVAYWAYLALSTIMTLVTTILVLALILFAAK